VCVCVQLLVTLVKSIADKQTDVDQLSRNAVFGARKLTSCQYSCVYLTDSSSDHQTVSHVTSLHCRRLSVTRLSMYDFVLLHV